MRIDYTQKRTSPFSTDSEKKSKEIIKTTSDHLDARIAQKSFNFNSINEIARRNQQESIGKTSFLQSLDNTYASSKVKKPISIRSNHSILLV